MSTLAPNGTTRPVFLPRLVPHLFSSEETERPAPRQLFIRTSSPLARQHNNTVEEFQFSIVGTGGPHKGKDFLKGRVLPPKTLAAMATVDKKVRKKFNSNPLSGQSLIVVDITPFAHSYRTTGTSTEFPQVQFTISTLLVDTILGCLKQYFGFPFMTEWAYNDDR